VLPCPHLKTETYLVPQFYLEFQTTDKFHKPLWSWVLYTTAKTLSTLLIPIHLIYTWIPLLRLATWRCDVTCSNASSSIVRRWRTLPSTLAARNVSLYCGNPASSSHRNTHAVSSSPAGIRWGSSVATVPCSDSRARCSFFRWIGFCRRHAHTDKSLSK
jgi:hypothetical protein